MRVTDASSTKPDKVFNLTLRQLLFRAAVLSQQQNYICESI